MFFFPLKEVSFLVQNQDFINFGCLLFRGDYLDVRQSS